MATFRYKQKKVPQNGFSIIEATVSLFILGTVIIIYSAASNSMVLNRNAKEQELALRIAQTEMETLRATTYALLPASGNISDALLSQLSGGAETLTVSAYNSNTKKIVVTVNWNSAGNVARSTSLTTLISKWGLGQ
jgi:type II secretory pathway pseudopilin PulG